MAAHAPRTELRLRGITRSHVFTTVAAAVPIVNVLYQTTTRPGLQLAWWIWVGCAVVSTLPWVARGLVRLMHQPSFDELGVFLGERAIPFAKLTEVVIGRKGRRRYLFLRRDKTDELCLILEDPYAGKLAPLAPLAAKLRAVRPDDAVVAKLVNEAGRG